MKLRIFLFVLAGAGLLALGGGAGLLLARELANRLTAADANPALPTALSKVTPIPPTTEISPTVTATSATIATRPAFSVTDTPVPLETALPEIATPAQANYPVISTLNAASLVPIAQLKIDPVDQAHSAILSAYITRFRWLQNGRQLAILMDNLAIFDVASQEITRTYPMPDYDTTGIISFDIHPAGQVAALGMENGQVLFLDLDSGSVTGQWSSGAPVTVLRFSPDGSLLVAFSAGNTGSQQIVFWYYPDGAVLPALTNQAAEKAGGYRVVTFTEDGSRVALAGAGKIHVWDVPGQAYYHTVPGALTVYAAAYTPDGAALAWSGVTWQVTVQEMNEDLWHRANFIPTTNAIWSLAYSPDGSLLAGASQSWDGEAAVTIWSAADLGKIIQLPGQVFSVAWSPDGTLLATTSTEGLKVWGVK